MFTATHCCSGLGREEAHYPNCSTATDKEEKENEEEEEKKEKIHRLPTRQPTGPFFFSTAVESLVHTGALRMKGEVLFGRSLLVYLAAIAATVVDWTDRTK